MAEKKTVKISKEVWKDLKIHAAKYDKRIEDVCEEALKEYIKKRAT